MQRNRTDFFELQTLEDESAQQTWGSVLDLERKSDVKLETTILVVVVNFRSLQTIRK